jgi:putative ABC transport system substrate-binding protein
MPPRSDVCRAAGYLLRPAPLRKPRSHSGDFGVENQVPVVTLAMVRVPGAALYIGADFKQVGQLAGAGGQDPQTPHQAGRAAHPAAGNAHRAGRSGPAGSAESDLPAQLAAHKTVAANGFWQIDLVKLVK